VSLQTPSLSGLYPSSYAVSHGGSGAGGGVNTAQGGGGGGGSGAGGGGGTGGAPGGGGGGGGGGGSGQPEFSLSSDLGLTSLHSVHGAWGAPVGSNSGGLVHHPAHLSSNIHLGSVSHLAVPSAVNQRPPSAPLSPSPVALKIKSEPISPPSLQVIIISFGILHLSGILLLAIPSEGQLYLEQS